MKQTKSKKNLFKSSQNNQRKKIIKNEKFKLNNTKRKKNYLISLLDKNSTKDFNSNKFNYNKEIYLTNAIENIKFNQPNKIRHHQNGNINIRLNLNNEIINNNFNNYYTINNKNRYIHKSKSNISLNEKIKEKDKLITKLQKDLLQSQEFLNQIQKEKQNELTFTFNTIKHYDNLGNTHSYSLNTLLNTPSLLKINFDKNRQKNKNYACNIFNPDLYYNNKKKYRILSSSPKSNYIRCFSSSPHRFFPYYLDNLESYNNFSINQKSLNNKRLNNRSNSNIFMKKNYNFPISNKLNFARHLSYSDFNYNSKNIINNNTCSNSNKLFIEKCEKLIKRAKTLLTNYISLIDKK